MPDGVPRIDPEVVAARILALLNERRCGAVKPLLAALERLAPDHEDLALLRASYLCQTGESPQALLVLADAITQQPGNAALFLRRAEIFFSQGNYADAAANAAEAVFLAPRLNRAKSALGLALLGLQKFDMALACLAESFAADPSGVDIALAIAALVPETASTILGRAIMASPHSSVLRNALTRCYFCIGDVPQALLHAEQTRADGAADAETYCLQAFGQMQEADWDAANISAARAQSLQTGNVWATRLAAALASRATGELRLPPEQDTARAEKELSDAGDILPDSFCALLQDLQCTGPVLDLYCGSGRNAIASQDSFPGPWTGIEPNAALLGLCAERAKYERLENLDPLEYLAEAGQGQTGRYPVILLNGALGLRACLQPWFNALRAGLSPGGTALAGIPVGRPGLTGHALFAHSLETITLQAERAGLRVAFPRSGILRHIEGIPLHGVIASFQAV